MAARERAEKGERSESERETGERERGRESRERERERETSIERVIGLERVPVARMHVKARARRGEHRVVEHAAGRAIFDLPVRGSRSQGSASLRCGGGNIKRTIFFVLPLTEHSLC
jgi:hypothetical protein